MSLSPETLEVERVRHPIVERHLTVQHIERFTPAYVRMRLDCRAKGFDGDSVGL